ncbi:hypothetical protein PMKS-003122 [Pichia membranifaciens]|uniref:Uncharacterized protein n=1 Tax=Pichia membranifaciens TaxID=4926 RepID=A0A1Q2YJH4_9ASCO|nr:hypothetical protein PMKS-003122 [Pichia membranifaciens]
MSVEGPFSIKFSRSNTSCMNSNGEGRKKVKSASQLPKMSDNHLIDDSQPEDLLDLSLSWEYINKEKEKSTRKAKQLVKLHKELQPLNKEFEYVQLTRTRNSSFHKNNQFTVVAAEFLNLSSKAELDQLYADGYSKHEIENMLENKYQEKKIFFTDLNVKHHKFKRKSFEAWRSMSNSHSVNTNTFTSEEECMSQISKSQQLRLKRINNKPLKKFTTVTRINEKINGILTKPSIEETNSTKKSSRSNSSSRLRTQPIRNTRIDIPNETSLLAVSSENDLDAQNSSLLMFSEMNEPQSITLEVTKTTTHNPSAVAKDNVAALHSSTLVPAEKLDHTTSGSDLLNQDSQIPNTQTELLEIFSEKKDTTFISSDQANNESPEGLIELPSSPEKMMTIPNSQGTVRDKIMNENISKIISSRRTLRHRTIVNKNPYLVDRAEYLGLSTKYELIYMTEEGKSDEEILSFLDFKYQQRRKERKDKEVGFGPYSKPTFYDIMNGKIHTDDLLAPTNADSLIESYQAIGEHSVSDQEFELSMDEESNHLSDTFNEDFDLINIESSKDGRQDQDHDLKNGLVEIDQNLPQMEDVFRFNMKELTSKANSPTSMTQRKKRKHITNTSSNAAKRQKSLEITGTTQVVADDASPIKLSALNSTAFNPYSMNFLTLSDEEPQPEQETNQAQPKTKVAKRKNQEKTVLESAKRPNRTSVASVLGQSNVSITKNASAVGAELQSKPGVPSLNTDTELKPSINNKQKNIIGTTHAPIHNSNYVFNRAVNTGTYQEEVLKPHFLDELPSPAITELNLDFAKDTSLKLKKAEDVLNPKILAEGKPPIYHLWVKYKESEDLKKQRYKFLLNLKPLDYRSLKATQSFLSSTLLARSLSEDGDFYWNKTIKVDFLSLKMSFEKPLKAEDTLSKMKAFHDILLGALKSNSFRKHQIKQLRNSLIHFLMLLSNIKRDCPVILPQVGMEMNSFLNRYKKNTNNNEILFCIFAPYFLIYMKMFQKLLPASSDFNKSFKNTASWLSKKIVYNICSISFEKIFVHTKSILTESLYIFLNCTSNPWSFVENLQHSIEIDVLNVLNFLYFCNSYNHVEMDWEYFTTILTCFCDKTEKQPTDLLLIKYIFASILKINRELKWDLEDHLLIRMFRLLAEYKFENIGSANLEKPTIYPNIPATDSLTEEDGCLDMYFKILNIYTKQYLSENTKSLVERLIPIRSTSGYSSVQLQNRAKVLLMMVYTFDQDLSSSLESILNDMIRNGSLYSLKSSFALIRTIIRQTPKRPYNLVRKYLPLLIKKINHSQPDREIFSIFKDLIFSVNELLNGQDISHLKRMVDFLAIILTFKHADADTGFEVVLNKSFMVLSQQYEFLNGVEISERDEIRLRKSLAEVSKNSKMRLLDENTKSFTINKLYLKFWLYAVAKSQQPAIQLLYTEWNYFGSQQLRDKYELTFFTYLVQSFDVSNIKEEVLTVFFRHLALIFTDLSSFFQGILKQKLLVLKKYSFQNSTVQSFQYRRIEITIKCLLSLFREKDEKMIYHVLKSFLVSLKSQLVNHEAKNFIKEVGLYLYTVANDKYDIPEWDYLVSKLKLEAVEGSLSKKIQFVETVEDTIFLLEKIYIGSIAGNTYTDFQNQMTQYSTMQVSRAKLLTSFCGIISFHVECILKSKSDHWMYLNHWMDNFSSHVVTQTYNQNMGQICKVFRILSKLNIMFATAYNYRFYYYKILRQLYALLKWSLRMFMGFDDSRLFVENFWIFAGMDPVVVNPLASSSIQPLIDEELQLKLINLYNTSDTILQGKVVNPATEKDLYLLENELKSQRILLVKNWKLPNIEDSVSAEPTDGRTRV